MTKTKKIAYWVFTLWMALGMVSTAYVQLMHADKEAGMLQHLGYPLYFLTLLGTWKILGTIAALIPRFALVKEWAYAGFFFAMSGAVVSHIAVGDGFKDIFPSLLLLVLTILSWALRPADRKIQLYV